MEFYDATGRRKEAVARVRLIPDGTGRVIVNNRPIRDYLTRDDLVIHALQPLELVNLKDKFDVKVKAKGGGLSGQAGAIRLGIARALVLYNPELRPILKKAGMLTRDPRMVERKKYGRRKARRSFQFSKR
ncbi:30S ribosomal protein S9 [bacterium]|nr:MAG: 30S ribosomal protein S9 [bacterium]